MSFLLKEIFSLIRILNSETGSKQIALGLTLGFILGLSPWISIQGILIFLFIIIFKVQAGAAFVSAALFSLITYVFDPLLHKLGSNVLKHDSLEGLWTTLYNAPLVPYTKFNNSVVMGGAVLGLILAPLMYFIFYKLVSKYQVTIVARFKNTKIWKAFKGSIIYNWYITYEKYKF